MLNVLFLCTGNSCRSIMAEALLNKLGKNRFHSFSAGSFPAGTVHPISLTTLERHHIPARGYSSKSWDIFKDLTEFHLVITVCDNAAGEVCPLFPGSPVKIHWPTPDPAHFKGTDAEILDEFDRVYGILENRIKALIFLQVDRLRDNALKEAVSHII